MRKLVLFGLAALVVVSIAMSVMLYQKYDKASHDFADAKSSESDAQKSYGDALTAIAEIQDSLAAMGVGEATQPVLPGSPATERGMSMMRGREALDRIALLKAGIRRTKDRLSELETRLHQQGVKVKGLERLIANLKTSVGEKEQLVAQLSGQVDSLHTQVTGLVTQVQGEQDTINVQGQKIENQRHELGTVYCMMGTKSSLAKSGLVVAKGGVLGIGKTLLPASTAMDDRLFTPIDTDAQTVIHIPAAKARVVTAQPASSYALMPAGKELDLHIIDPQEFRTVKHVVIVTS